MSNVGQTNVTPHKHGEWWDILVWRDGKRVREHICRVSGPDALGKLERRKKAQEILDVANSKAPTISSAVLPEIGYDKITVQEAFIRWIGQRRDARTLSGRIPSNSTIIIMHVG